MNVLEITYDLRAPGRDYSTLYSAIRSFGNWCRPLESVWLIATMLGAGSVRDMLQRHIDSNDGLLVSGTISEAAWFGISPEVTEWIRRQLAPVARI